MGDKAKLAFGNEHVKKFEPVPLANGSLEQFFVNPKLISYDQMHKLSNVYQTLGFSLQKEKLHDK